MLPSETALRIKNTVGSRIAKGTINGAGGWDPAGGVRGLLVTPVSLNKRGRQGPGFSRRFSEKALGKTGLVHHDNTLFWPWKMIL